MCLSLTPDRTRIGMRPGFVVVGGRCFPVTTGADRPAPASGCGRAPSGWADGAFQRRLARPTGARIGMRPGFVRVGGWCFPATTSTTGLPADQDPGELVRDGRYLASVRQSLRFEREGVGMRLQDGHDANRRKDTIAGRVRTLTMSNTGMKLSATTWWPLRAEDGAHTALPPPLRSGGSATGGGAAAYRQPLGGRTIRGGCVKGGRTVRASDA